MKQHLVDSGRIVVHEECGCMATVDEFHPCDVHQQEPDERHERFLEAAVDAQRKYNEEGLHGDLDPEDPWDAHKVQDGN